LILNSKNSSNRQKTQFPQYKLSPLFPSYWNFWQAPSTLSSIVGGDLPPEKLGGSLKRCVVRFTHWLATSQLKLKDAINVNNFDNW